MATRIVTLDIAFSVSLDQLDFLYMVVAARESLSLGDGFSDLEAAKLFLQQFGKAGVTISQNFSMLKQGNLIFVPGSKISPES
jgi:hypothetical protein